MNELKFGHRVISWDNDKDNYTKGRFILCDDSRSDTPFVILKDNGYAEEFKGCELDPNATEFLTMDEVEFSMDGEGWSSGVYSYYDSELGWHVDTDGGRWKYCRYPKEEEEEVNINANEAIYDELTDIDLTHLDEMLQGYRKNTTIEYLKDLTPEELCQIINQATNQ